MGKLTRKELKEQYMSREVIGGVFAIRCNASGNRWIRSTMDLQGSRNRLGFSISVNSCPEPGMLEDWKQHGADSFSLEVLEEIRKKDTQTEKEFSDDVDTLLQMWLEGQKSEEGK